MVKKEEENGKFDLYTSVVIPADDSRAADPFSSRFKITSHF